MKLITSMGIVALLAPIWVFNVGVGFQNQKLAARIAAFHAEHTVPFFTTTPGAFQIEPDPTEWWRPPSAFETPDSDQWIIGDHRYTGRALMGVRL